MTFPDFSAWEWLQAYVAAVLCGISKAGLAGVGLITVLIMAHLIPGQASSGVVLPMLIAADILAASRYREHIQWNIILRVGIPMVVGVGLGTWFMWATKTKPDAFFNRIVAGLVLSMCGVQWARMQWPALDQHLPNSKIFAWITGLLGGIATMLANAAGPISTLYLLIVGLAKREFVHTMAWWFLILNIMKVPFSYGLGLISGQSLGLNLALLPGIFLGFAIGRKLLDRIPQAVFSRIVTAFAVVFAMKLLFFA